MRKTILTIMTLVGALGACTDKPSTMDRVQEEQARANAEARYLTHTEPAVIAVVNGQTGAVALVTLDGSRSLAWVTVDSVAYSAKPGDIVRPCNRAPREDGTQVTRCVWHTPTEEAQQAAQRALYK